MSDDLTIADVLSRGVSVEWYEAVALVRDVADRLLDLQSSRTFPDLSNIRLTPAGHVELDGAARADEPVRRLAQLLQALVVQADAPVQLRLLIAQATAPTPPFDSPQAFADALAYYERPQRTTILCRLYKRVAAAPASEAAATTLDALAPLPASEGAAAHQRKAIRRGPYVAVVAVAIVVAAGVAAATQYVRTHAMSKQTRDHLASVAGRASFTVGGAVLSGASKVTDLLGLGRVVPADSPVPPRPAPAAAPAPHPRQRRMPQVLPATAPQLIAFDLEPTAPMTAISRAAADTTPAVDAEAPRDSIHDDDVTFSEGADGVTPPVAIRPRLPRELPPPMRMSDLSRLELVIGRDGTVESVKLLGGVPSILETMFVSVAKAWQFEPAVRHGEPVRYRKTIWILNP